MFPLDLDQFLYQGKLIDHCSGVWGRVCDNDRDLDGEPEETRLAGSFPDGGGEGRLLQGRHDCAHDARDDVRDDVYGDDNHDYYGGDHS